jgi:mRNA (guanine-N7-)-methyltransferase
MDNFEAENLFSQILNGNVDESLLIDRDISGMREFHNFIKKMLITQFASNKKTLLDIAVGRGGDLFKWKMANIKIVVGFDVHKNSIIEAKRRLNDSLNSYKLPYTQYFEGNILDENIEHKLYKIESRIKGLQGNQYDVISCQFAFHYFTKSPSYLHYVLRFISSKLHTGGYFIGTAADGDIINGILSKKNVNSDLLQLNKLEDNEYIFNIATNTGSSTYFDIKGKSKEYYVFKDELVNSAAIYNLELIEINSFYSWYTKYNKTIKKNEGLISFLNFSFVFRKC